MLRKSFALLAALNGHISSTGYSEVGDAISESNASAFLKRIVPGVWLHFSIHLATLAAFGILASFSKRGARGLVTLLAIAVAADAALVFSFAGFFAGVALLAAAAFCFALAAVQPLPRGSGPHGVGT